MDFQEHYVSCKARQYEVWGCSFFIYSAKIKRKREIGKLNSQEVGKSRKTDDDSILSRRYHQHHSY
jgi:hypothetical protein